MLFPSVLCDLIFSYCDKTVLDDFIDEKKLDWGCLSANPHPWAIEQLKANLREAQAFGDDEKINWWELSRNPHPWAIEQLKNDRDKIDWWGLSANPHPWAIEQLKENMRAARAEGAESKINWWNLSANPNIFIKDKRIKIVLLNLKW